MITTWLKAAAILAGAACLALPAVGGEATPQPTTMTCTNPISGAQWQIRIDYAQSRVDAEPAQVSDTQISWRDSANGFNYTLDRRSGDLTMVAASSTGGYFLHDRCAPEKSD
jgi:hypothetical protein